MEVADGYFRGRSLPQQWPCATRFCGSQWIRHTISSGNKIAPLPDPLHI